MIWKVFERLCFKICMIFAVKNWRSTFFVPYFFGFFSFLLLLSSLQMLVCRFKFVLVIFKPQITQLLSPSWLFLTWCFIAFDVWKSLSQLFSSQVIVGGKWIFSCSTNCWAVDKFLPHELHTFHSTLKPYWNINIFFKGIYDVAQNWCIY